MNETVTRGQLATMGMDALDKTRAGEIVISREAGGVSFTSAVEVMEFAKLMSVGGESIPKHLQNNPGACLRIVFQAIEWKVSPYAVADQSYAVGGRMAYMAQLIHAIIEARAPLKKRLETEYSGEGPTRRIKVIGTFLDGEIRTYESPEFKDIKVKNSPLWVGDLDQQFHYFGTRSWGRRWTPDVLFGIYTPDEIRAGMAPAQEVEAAPLKDRLQGPAPGSEGHAHGHADRELSNIVADGKVEILPPQGKEGGAAATPSGKSRAKAPGKGKTAGNARKGAAEPTPKAVEHAANKAEDAGRTPDLTNQANVMPKSAASAAADRAEATSKQRAAGTQATASAGDKVAPPSDPKTPAEYEAYVLAYVERATDADNLEARWDGERDKRDELVVPMLKRKELEKIVYARCNELRGS